MSTPFDRQPAAPRLRGRATIVLGLAVASVACSPERATAPAPRPAAGHEAPAPVDVAVAVDADADADADADGLSVLAPPSCAEDERVVLEARWPAAPEATFTWTQSSGPPVKLLSTNAATLSFTAPQALADYQLEFECRAVWGSETRTLRRTLAVRADDDAPLAQTFVAPRSECGAVLLLTGQGQNPEILQGITYEWRQVGEGPRVELEYADRPQAWCRPPELGASYTLRFEFRVSDGVNEPTTAPVEVEVECDPRFAPLAPEQELELPRAPFLESPLPRGAWVMRGVLHLIPNAPDRLARVTLRLPGSPTFASAVTYQARDGAGLVRRHGVERNAQGDWREPEMSGNRDLGAWPPERPLGLELAWDGEELKIRFGAPGERSTWEEPRFPVDLPLASRPRSLHLEVDGAQLEISELRLIGR